MAVVFTLLFFGGQLYLAEHYAQSGAADLADHSMTAGGIKVTTQSICPNFDQPPTGAAPSHPAKAGLPPNKTA